MQIDIYKKFPQSKEPKFLKELLRWMLSGKQC